ncbi:Predicted arabinose efflux permease, MFS family [Fontibacillus panacisegetis]|uniref:Predicted arabinose efflux permease, MFS family n=1 Tax=Fontibacillus panacisegetis TaxID=670482 RepID=A0A1G7U419_9BACL|nr:MFS transporter [Fontibacillus panacisegetis]SDG42372.1 Predicted arabinose efflux permease, MFS family [Fontibacillus panacisegetis]
MKWWQSYPKEVRILLIASLINSAGNALLWPLVTMFVFKILGRTVTDAGLVILVMSIGGIIGQVLGGALYHRVGVKRLIVGGLGLNALFLLSLPFGSGNWSLYMCLMAMIGFFNAISMPAMQAFIGFRFPERRGELFNAIYVANNIGVALGTSLSGFLVQISYNMTFILNGLTSGCFAVFFWFYLNKVQIKPGELHVEKKKSTQTESPWTLLTKYQVYLFMGIGSLFLWLGNCVWNNGVAPYTISRGMPEWYYSVLWTLNGVLIFVGQPFISWIRRTFAGSAQSQMTASAIFYMMGYITILVYPTYPSMVLAMVLATFGEMLISPAIPEFISEHTGKSAPFYIGVVGGMGAAGRVVGPYTMGMLFDWNGLVPVVWLSVIIATFSIISFSLHAYMNREREQKAYITM